MQPMSGRRDGDGTAGRSRDAGDASLALPRAAAGIESVPGDVAVIGGVLQRERIGVNADDLAEAVGIRVASYTEDADQIARLQAVTGRCNDNRRGVSRRGHDASGGGKKQSRGI